MSKKKSLKKRIAALLKKKQSNKSNKILMVFDDQVEIHIFNEIVQDWGFSSRDLVEELSSLDSDTPLLVRINSPGGEAFEGLAIYNILRQWKGEVTSVVEGIAASAAVLPFLAADKRIMNENSLLMIHNPASGAFGTADDIEETIEVLRKLETEINSIYQSRSNATESDLKEWLVGDTYFDSAEAVAAGFATEVQKLPEVRSKIDVEKLVLKLRQKDKNMGFEAWLKAYCEPLGIDSEDLTTDQRTTLKSKYDIEMKKGGKKKGDPKPPPIPKDTDDDEAIKLRRVKLAAENERVASIEEVSLRYKGIKFNEEYLKEIGLNVKTVRGIESHAVREGWTSDKFELELRRAERKDVGTFAIHNAPDRREINVPAMSASLVRSAGVPASKEHKHSGEKWGYEHFYDEKTLDASDNFKNLGLQQVMNMAVVEANGSGYDGRLNTDGFISACREALWKIKMSGNTTWTGLNIFDDAANKMLWAAYESQNTTWQEWVKQMPVNDFKTHNTYRLTSKGAYQQVGADGELKHGGFTDDKYTHSADTYGKIVGLSRRDIINDDLGALQGIMGLLGAEGAKFLEELFYEHLLGQITTLFPTADTNKNYISGTGTDLGIDGLSEAEQKAADQVDGDNSPILIPADLLLCGTQDSVLAHELHNQLALTGLQTANQKKRPDQNPHISKYRPVVSGYHNNTQIKQRIDNIGQAISNQTTDHWILARSPGPSGGLVIGSFLNGNVRPTIESGDASFEVLGLQWRAYHDAGSDNGDPKWGVFSKGAA